MNPPPPPSTVDSEIFGKQVCPPYPLIELQYYVLNLLIYSSAFHFIVVKYVIIVICCLLLVFMISELV